MKEYNDKVFSTREEFWTPVVMKLVKLSSGLYQGVSILGLFLWMICTSP